jgi:ubiquinone/menaquinone biosynthesis C-methylase UbiE
MSSESWHALFVGKLFAVSWDSYAPYYDWENARTLGRRDLPFWRDLILRSDRPALELGCGTGRLLAPMARAGGSLTGIDLSEPMLARARKRLARLPRTTRPALVRGDIRALPFRRHSFGVVLASYGMLQSLLSDADLEASIGEAARVLEPGGTLGIDLVPDLPRWEPYERKVSLRGRLNTRTTLTLVETVRQDRRRGLTHFDEEFVERRGRTATRRRFTLSFRTVPMSDLCARVEAAGFRIEAMLGSYRGQPWDPRAAVWVVLAIRQSQKTPRPRRHNPAMLP